MNLQEQARQLKDKLAEQNKIFEAQDARAKAVKDAGQSDEDAYKAATATADEAAQAKKLGTEIDELYKTVSDLKEREDARKTNSDRLKEISQTNGRPQFGNDERRQEVKSMGQSFTQSEEFKSWLKQVSPSGDAPPSFTRLESPAVDMKGLVYTSATTGGGYVRRDYAPNVDFPLRKLTIRDVISNGRTGSNMIEYVRVTSKTRAANTVPEATATTSTGYDNAVKPEASMASVVVQDTVKTIAVWMPATRQILSDVPQMESMIDNFLREDVDLELEDQIISGTGGTGFTGIENTAGVTPQAFATDALTTTRKARTTSMVIGRAVPTAYLLNPYDWEAIDLTVDGESRYYFGGPMQMGIKTLWGLPVVESEAIPRGTFYTGDLRQMMVWDREQATTRITDSHSDFFTHNMIAILTEGRYAFGVFRPAAIVRGDLLSGANS